MKKIALTQMKSGQSGVVAEVLGGYGIARRLEALGIRTGQKITKISGMIMRGPITILVGQTHIGIGFGMASRIIVEVG
ncbi:MAG: FeoA family protein [bacterium]